MLKQNLILNLAFALKVRTMHGHDQRAGTLAWNNHVLCSGSKDCSILQRDVRDPADYFRQLTAHRQEVCGLQVLVCPRPLPHVYSNCELRLKRSKVWVRGGEAEPDARSAFATRIFSANKDAMSRSRAFETPKRDHASSSLCALF